METLKIDLHDPSAAPAFVRGEIVFQIKYVPPDGEEVDHTIVTQYQEYRQKLYTHKYSPLLFGAPLLVRLAYLYDCLNRSYREEREGDFIFYFRRLNHHQWSKWFTVHPYLDSETGLKSRT